MSQCTERDRRRRCIQELQLVLVLAVAETRGTEVVTGCVMKDFEVHA